MATYRINQKNSIFKGFRGEIVIAEPGPLLDAAVRSGILSRQADEPSTSKNFSGDVPDETDDQVTQRVTKKRKKSSDGDNDS